MRLGSELLIRISTLVAGFKRVKFVVAAVEAELPAQILAALRGGIFNMDDGLARDDVVALRRLFTASD